MNAEYQRLEAEASEVQNPIDEEKQRWKNKGVRSH